MSSLVSAYLFLLGLASGVTLLTISTYRHVSPAWLKGLLIASGLFVISRYLAMACFTTPEAPQRCWALRHCWLATSVGLTLPSVLAIDQLLRHPAMSPKKLLMWFSPFLVAYGVIVVFGHFTPVPDRVVGWVPELRAGWRLALSIVQGVFVVGFLGLCVMLMRKIPSRPIRLALLGLMLGHAYLGFDGLLLARGAWYFRPFLYSEILTLLALGHAYDTAAALQRSS